MATIAAAAGNPTDGQTNSSAVTSAPTGYTWWSTTHGFRCAHGYTRYFDANEMYGEGSTFARSASRMLARSSHSPISRFAMLDADVENLGGPRSVADYNNVYNPSSISITP